MQSDRLRPGRGGGAVLLSMLPAAAQASRHRFVKSGLSHPDQIRDAGEDSNDWSLGASSAAIQPRWVAVSRFRRCSGVHVN